MTAEAAAAEGDAPFEDEPAPTHPYVEALTGLPGVEHVAVVDAAGQRVLGEWGGPTGSADPLLERARAAADGAGRRELEDVVSTTASAFHLSRLVLAGPGHPESVWVALRVNRAQGSLPWSRAALAGLDGPTGAPLLRPQIPAPREPDDRSDPSVPAPRVVPPPPAPHTTSRTTPPAAGTTAPPPAPAAVPPPSTPVAPRARVVLTTRMPVPAPAGPDDQSADTAETLVVEAATTVELGLAPAAAPTPTPTPAPAPAPAPEPTVVEPGRRSSFAPVMVVLPPPSPVPEDDRTEEPAPMPAPIIIAPDPAAGPSVEPALAVVDEAPAISGAPADAVGYPDEQAHPNEPKVMRRLIHGLRRRP